MIVIIDTDKELLSGQGRKLSDYELIHGSTITVCLRVRGGGNRLTPLPGLISVTYDQPDMITLDDSPLEPKAVMPCKHVISQYGFSCLFSLATKPTDVYTD